MSSLAQAELIGREAESQRLDELIEGLAHSGGALIVRGQAGIGKSRCWSVRDVRAGA